MGKVCSCITQHETPNLQDINCTHDSLNNDSVIKAKSGPALPDSLDNEPKAPEERDFLLLVKMIIRFWNRKVYYKRVRPDLISQTDKMISEYLSKVFNEKVNQVAERENNRDIQKNYNFRSRVFKCKILLINAGNETTDMYCGELDIMKKKNGFGKLFKSDGSIYYGNWEEDLLHGDGRYIDKDGNLFEGEFFRGFLVKGNYIKFGVLSTYSGDWKAGKRHGIGKEENEETLYEGAFEADHKHGYGKIFLKLLGETYEGDFLNGDITGKGVYTWKNNNVYRGDFLKGQLHGKGHYIWHDGGEYEGDYVLGIKHGFGRYKMKDGNIYTGPFLNGQPHGIGTLLYKGKELTDIEFEEGRIKRPIMTKKA